jgi:chorismate mutase
MILCVTAESAAIFCAELAAKGVEFRCLPEHGLWNIEIVRQYPKCIS